MDGAVCDGEHQYAQRASLKYALGIPLWKGFRLRRNDADRPGRARRSQRKTNRRGRQCREDGPWRTKAGRRALKGRPCEGLLRSPVCGADAGWAPGPCGRQGKLRSRLRIDLKNDLRMRDLSGRNARGGGGYLDSRRGNGTSSDQAACRSRGDRFRRRKINWTYVNGLKQ